MTRSCRSIPSNPVNAYDVDVFLLICDTDVSTLLCITAVLENWLVLASVT